MDLNYLTINNITKICDDNLYLDESGNLTQFQWYDFQLDFALKNLENDLSKFMIHPLTGYKLTRKEILILIKKIFGMNKINTKAGIKIEELKKYGLYKGDGIKNYYVPETLGGLSELIYDDKTDTVLLPKNYRKTSNNTISDSNTTIKSLRYKKKFTISKRGNKSSSVKSSKSTDSTISSTSSISTKSTVSTSSENSTKKRTVKIPRGGKKSNIFKPISTNQQRTNKGLSVIQNSDDICRKMGKFDWKRNSCYADSILLGVIYNAILNKRSPDNPIGSYIYHTITTKRYTSDNLGNIQLCPNKSIDETVVILNTILDNLKDIVGKIENGKIISIQSLLKGINDLCSNLFTENYYDGKTHDVKDFYSNLMFILGINTTNYNKKTTLFFKLEDTQQLLTEPFITNPYDRTKIRTVDGLGNYIIGYQNQQSDNSPISTIEVLSNYIFNKYSQQGIRVYSKQIYEEDRSQYQYIYKLGGYIKKTERLLVNTKLNNVSFDIREFLDTKHHDLFLEDDEIVYKYYDDNITDDIYMGERYYYKKEDKGNYEKYKKSSEISSELGFRTGLKVENLIIDNSSLYINFNINRTHSVYLQSGLISNVKLNIKINLVESFNLSDNDYKLDYIVCWFSNHYVTIFRCGEKYYLYDDTLVGSDDYIYEIGNFNNLMTYNHGRNNLFALRNSVFISYSR